MILIEFKLHNGKVPYFVKDYISQKVEGKENLNRAGLCPAGLINGSERMIRMIKKLLVGWLLIMFVLVGCHSVVPPPPPPPPDPVYRGLFVGVTDYIYFNSIDLMSPAENTVKLENLFTNARFGEGEIAFERIERLTNYNATHDNILAMIQEVFGEAEENDVSYFYFMGHGSDSHRDYPSLLPADFDTTFSSHLTVHELEEALSAIQGTKVVLIEACHSGNFIDRSRDSFNNFNNQVISIFANHISLDLLNKESYQVLCSSAGSESSWDSNYGSYFCRHFISGCEDLSADTVYGGNEDGIVNLKEIYNWIYNRVTNQTVQMYPQDSDFPIYEE